MIFTGLIFVAGQKTAFSDAGLKAMYMFIVAIRQGTVVVVVYMPSRN